MGGGSYSDSDYESIVSTRLLSEKSGQSSFTSVGLHPTMNICGKIREARVSEDHPRITPVVIGLDETGSMLSLPKELATGGLRKMMSYLMSLGIDGPQIMNCAFGDALCHERAPIQVGQFESTASAMDNNLVSIYLEGGGGPNRGESADLLLYYIGHRTELDIVGGAKPVAFIITDEPTFSTLPAEVIRLHLGVSVSKDVPIRETLDKVLSRYELVVLSPGNPSPRKDAESFWRPLIGANYIVFQNPTQACQLMAVIVALNNIEGSIEDHFDTLGVKSEDRRGLMAAIAEYANAMGRTQHDLPTLVAV